MAIEALLPTAEPTADNRNRRLSAREVEVVELIVQGKTNPEIGTILGIAVDTVKKHSQNIMVKVGCSTRVQLAYLWSNQAEADELRLQIADRDRSLAESAIELAAYKERCHQLLRQIDAMKAAGHAA